MSSPNIIDRTSADTPIVIKSPAMREVMGMARRVAATSAPVLILGETGTGKEVIAQLIHQASSRSSRAYRSINCAALPPQLIASVLFGHEKGAFTGAMTASAGIFEQARHGTLLLDEIGELGADAQAALLRVLETGRVTRIGAAHEISIDARVIAATHRNLERMVEEGAFRQDLLYRMNTVVLELPPLRERRSEILELARVFLRAPALRLHDLPRELHSETQALLLAYPWPGNVRELRNALERAALLSDERVIEPCHLPASIRNGTARPSTLPPSGERHAGSEPAALGLRDALRRYEAEMIQDALERAGGNQRLAARRLQIPLRTLVRKLRELRTMVSLEVTGASLGVMADASAEPHLARLEVISGATAE